MSGLLDRIVRRRRASASSRLGPRVLNVNGDPGANGGSPGYVNGSPPASQLPTSVWIPSAAAPKQASPPAPEPEPEPAPAPESELAPEPESEPEPGPEPGPEPEPEPALRWCRHHRQSRPPSSLSPRSRSPSSQSRSPSSSSLRSRSPSSQSRPPSSWSLRSRSPSSQSLGQSCPRSPVSSSAGGSAAGRVHSRRLRELAASRPRRISRGATAVWPRAAELVQAKLAGAVHTDAELRALQRALGADQPLRELREADRRGM